MKTDKQRKAVMAILKSKRYLWTEGIPRGKGGKENSLVVGTNRFQASKKSGKSFTKKELNKLETPGSQERKELADVIRAFRSSRPPRTKSAIAIVAV